MYKKIFNLLFLLPFFNNISCQVPKVSDKTMAEIINENDALKKSNEQLLKRIENCQYNWSRRMFTKLMDLGEYAAAREVVEWVDMTDNDNKKYFLDKIGRTFFEEGNHEKAIEQWEKAIVVESNGAVRWLLVNKILDALEAQKKYREILKRLIKAGEDDPNYIDTYFQKIAFYLDKYLNQICPEK